MTGPGPAGFLARRIRPALMAQLTQGLTPERLALTLALGLALSTVPVLGATTLLCALAAFSLRLNQPAIQLANYLAYPLQLALYLPFFRAGARLFGAAPIQLSLAGLKARLAADAGGAAVDFGVASLHAVGAWALTAPAAVGLAYLALRPLLRRWALRADRGRT